MLVEFLVGLLDVFLTQSNSGLSTITSWLMFIFSMPISFIRRDLPFYAAEGAVVGIFYWVLNLLIQTAIVYVVIELCKNRKNN